MKQKTGLRCAVQNFQSSVVNLDVLFVRALGVVGLGIQVRSVLVICSPRFTPRRRLRARQSSRR